MAEAVDSIVSHAICRVWLRAVVDYTRLPALSLTLPMRVMSDCPIDIINKEYKYCAVNGTSKIMKEFEVSMYTRSFIASRPVKRAAASGPMDRP